MPASISPTKFPEIGIECSELAFLPGPCEDKDSDSSIVLRGPAVPCHFGTCKPRERKGSAADSLSSGATTPGEESELEDQSEYEFNADGQREYYDFLREMGCDFKQPQDSAEENDGFEELDEEGDAEFTPDGQEDYYDFLREMGCPFEARAAGANDEEEEEWDTEEEEEVWDEDWNESASIAAHPRDAGSVSSTEPMRSVSSTEPMRIADFGATEVADIEDADGDDDFGIGQRFGQHISIAPGPSPFLQKALLEVAAQRKELKSHITSTPRTQ